VESKRIADAALHQLSLFDFPGNVRQLENICHWLTVMAPSQVIEAKDLPPEVRLTAACTSPPSSLQPSPPLAEAAPPGDVPSTLAAAWPVVTVSPLLAASPASSPPGLESWESGLEAEALALLATGQTDVWDVLTRRFESKLIQTALLNTRGRRIEAAVKLGIGRNTITRKIQELGLE